MRNIILCAITLVLSTLVITTLFIGNLFSGQAPGQVSADPNDDETPEYKALLKRTAQIGRGNYDSDMTDSWSCAYDRVKQNDRVMEAEQERADQARESENYCGYGRY